MKIKLKISYNSDDAECHKLEINGEEKYGIYPLYDCPEDAIIGRDLLNGRDIIQAIMLGYNAGKSGEEISVEYEENPT